MNSTKSKPVRLLLIHKFCLSVFVCICIHFLVPSHIQEKRIVSSNYLRFLSFGSAVHANGPSAVVCCPMNEFRWWWWCCCHCRLRYIKYYSTGTADWPSSAAAKYTACFSGHARTLSTWFTTMRREQQTTRVMPRSFECPRNSACCHHCCQKHTKQNRCVLRLFGGAHAQSLDGSYCIEQCCMLFGYEFQRDNLWMLKALIPLLP